MSAGRSRTGCNHRPGGTQEQAALARLLALNTLSACASDGGPDNSGIILGASAIHDICNNMQMLAVIKTDNAGFSSDDPQKVISVQDHLVRTRYSELGRALQRCLPPGLS